MRILVILSAVTLSACALIPGGESNPIPFTASPAPVEARSDYPVSIDLPGGTYRLDQRHASVIFRIRHMDLAWFTARFDARNATLQLDPSDPSRSGLSASVDAASVNTGVLNDDGERAFDAAIARAIGAEITPQITFVSNRIERTGEFTALIHGDLTMNGETHPLTLNATFGGGRVDPLRGAMAIGFSAYGQLNRSDWSVTQWALFTGDEVQIVIEAEFVKV
jgi:polyisoprenoid-binding protein YceI